MSDQTWQVLAFGVAALAFLLSLATFLREGKWKDSEAAKAMSDDLADHGERLTALETEQKNLATKADIASLRAEFHGLEKVVTREVAGIQQSVKSTDAAIIRVEQFLMQGGAK